MSSISFSVFPCRYSGVISSFIMGAIRAEIWSESSLAKALSSCLVNSVTALEYMLELINCVFISSFETP